MLFGVFALGIRSRLRIKRVYLYIVLSIVFVSMFSMLYILPPGSRDRSPPFSSDVVTSPVGSAKDMGVQGFIRVFASYSEVLFFLSSLYSKAQDSVIESATPGVAPRMVTPVMPLASGSGVSVRYSSTNVQVAGIDEIDPVKSDGRIIVVSSGDRVYIVDASRNSLASVIPLRGSARGVFLWGSYLVILVGIGSAPYPRVLDRVSMPLFYPFTYENTSVYVYDISSPSRPVQRLLLDYSGFLSGARMINGSIYLVLSTPARPGLIPSINGSPISVSKIYLVDPVPSSFATVASIDIAGGGHSEISLLISSTSWIYMSPSRLYIVSYRGYIDAHISALSALARYLPGDLGSRVYSEALSGNISGALRLVENYLGSLDLDSAKSIVSRASGELSGSSFQDGSRVFVIDVRGSSISYRGYIDIPGSVLDQFSIEERGGYLVVGTTSRNASLSIGLLETRIPAPRNVSIRITECSSTCTERIVSIEATAIPAPPPKISIYMNLLPSGNTSNNVIIASIGDMKIKGLLENLARGERIYAARLLNNIFYLVTFRQVDPLYAIDIGNPEKPVVIGYIKIPGYSEYLHPVDNRTLVGIGVEGSGLKIAIYNITDPRNISEKAVLKMEGVSSQALWDHHAVTVDLDNRLLLIPVARDGVSGVAVIGYSQDRLHLRAILSHEGVFRSLYIGDRLYTISHDKIKIFSSESLERVGEIAFPPL